MAKTWTHGIISGAGSGLGHGLAERLLVRGCSVSVLDLSVSAERAAALNAAASKGASAWEHFTCDITNSGAVQSAVKQAVAAFGTPDLAVNSAGVASLAGITSNYGYAAYGTSKFAVRGLATTLRQEYEPRGIHISRICPPEVATPMVAAERATGNLVSLDLKDIAGTLQVDEACDGIMAGIDAGRWLIIPGIKAKLTAFAALRLPGLFYAVTAMLTRSIMRKHGAV